MSDPQRRELLERLAEVDRGLLQAIEERLKLCRELGRLGEPPSRDAEAWLADLLERRREDLPAEALRGILMSLRAEGEALARPSRVAITGPEGDFAHQVGVQHFGHASRFEEFRHAADALSEVVRGRADFAVIPFESSADGLMQGAIDSLMDTDLSLVGERRLAAVLDLRSRNANVSDVEKIYLTSGARVACERFLRDELPKVTLLDVRSPTVAAQLAAGDDGAAAIVPAGLETRELKTARRHVGDATDLRFRFGIVAPKPAPRSGDDMTSLVFSVDDTAGALFDALRHFAERGVNLRRLQSRPVRGESWDYVFYVEVSGHVTDRALVTAVESIRRSTRFVKVLGSFPVER